MAMAAAAPTFSLLLLLLLSHLLISMAAAINTTSDNVNSLLLLKQALSNPPSLSSWNPSSSPCNPKSNWTGVSCDVNSGAVVRIVLESLALSGNISIAALSRLNFLRIVSFANNSFTGPIPAFNKIVGLKALYLSHNHFAGMIPDDFFAGMDRLHKLNISNNNFSGPIPSSLSTAPLLLELSLANNHFTGAIPAALAAKFNKTSFAKNPDLCGPPFADKPCTSPPPPPPISDPPPPPPAETPAADEASSDRDSHSDSNYHANEFSGGTHPVTAAIISVAVLAVILFLVIVVVVAIVRKRQRVYDTLNGNGGIEAGDAGLMVIRRTASAKRRAASGEGSRSRRRGVVGASGELVMVNDDKGVFAMTDLMKAAAEMMGNGRLGSAYKAVMGNGTAVAVKRMREMNRAGKETFDVELRRMGRLNHRNVLPPLAYHYKKEEKLLIYEYIPKGSLMSILHGEKGTDHRSALDWPTRLKIAVGVARGMSYLHDSLDSLDVPHGNLKSSNILIGSDFEPLLVDYGLIALVNPSYAADALFSYKSPEYLAHRHLSPKSDVYCLGVVILELVTGKFPSQYLGARDEGGGIDVVALANSAMHEDQLGELIDPAIAISASLRMHEIERLVHIAAACAEPNLVERLEMKQACRQIEELAADASSVVAKETMS